MSLAKILIIEDDSILQKTVEEYLVEENFEVLSAVDGEEGVRMANQANPDLILLDIILPKKDGYAVIEEIRKNSKTAKTPIIIFTNLGGIHDVEKALELGATTYLIKSDYKLEDLVKKIKELLKIQK